MLQAADADSKDLSDTDPVRCSSNLLNTCDMNSTFSMQSWYEPFSRKWQGCARLNSPEAADEDRSTQVLCDY